MIVTDPIADMLTRIRNALMAKHVAVIVPVSKEKLAIAKILKEEGYIESYREIEGEKEYYDIVDKNNNFEVNTTKYVQKYILIKLKYSADKQQVITNLRRISKPGLRVYVNATEIPKVLNGMGIAILSTNKGIITDKQARALNVGGEVLAYVW